jgi:dTDP-4-amino-4,6-dideoxygalactose transaminase
LGVRSGTAALVVALKALEFQKDDEIITTPMTFSATTDAIILAGAKLVFADINLSTGNLDPINLQKALTRKTKAVLIVHFAGIPCEMTEITNFCKKNNLFLIEDVSHAHGSIYKNKKTGSFGDVACFSFYPSKAFRSLGNAGIITTSNKKILKKCQMFAEHGLYGKKYKHRLVGYNEKIDNLQAAFLNVKFPFLETWIEKRLRIAKRYQEIFVQKGVRAVDWPNYSKPSLYVFSILIKNRNKFAKYLLDNGVGSGIYYPIPLHLQESLNFLGYKKGDFQNAEFYAKQTLSIPFYPELEEKEMNFICELIKKYNF